MFYCRVRGDALRGLKDYDKAEKDYRGAVEIDDTEALAWQGLSLVAEAHDNVLGIIECNEKMLSLLPASDTGSLFRVRSLLATACARAGQYERAAQLLQLLVAHEDLFAEEKLDLQCRLADALLKQQDARVARIVELRRSQAESAAAEVGEKEAGEKEPGEKEAGEKEPGEKEPGEKEPGAEEGQAPLAAPPSSSGAPPPPP
ncbi:hypothetical protein H632_c388p2, partial [Helicosporidium sp. ATCC 50920]